MGVSLIPAPWTGSLYTRKPPKQETEKIDKSHVSPPGKTVEAEESQTLQETKICEMGRRSVVGGPRLHLFTS